MAMNMAIAMAEDTDDTCTSRMHVSCLTSHAYLHTAFSKCPDLEGELQFFSEEVAGMYQDKGVVVILMGVVQVHAKDTTNDSHQGHTQRQRCQQQLQLSQAEQGAESGAF